MVITICGSARFAKEMLHIAFKMEMQGHCILIPIFDPDKATKDDLTEDEGNLLAKMHLERIKLSDAILVVNIDGYIGDSTRHEITFARSLNKTIMYYDDLIHQN